MKRVTMGKPIPFYATKSDLQGLLSAVSATAKLAVTECGMFERSQPHTVPLDAADSLGISETGNHITDKTYLIHDDSMEIKVREIPQKNGGVRFSVDQRENLPTIGLKAGGEFGSDIVISGQLGVGTGNPRSDELASLFLRAMKRQFKKVKSYYVGPEAGSRLDSGARLTINSAASTEYDLAR